jgi:hypothetical protein
MIERQRRELDDQNLLTERARQGRNQVSRSNFLGRHRKLPRQIELKIFVATLEIDSGFSNSIIAAYGRCRAPALGPAD